MFTKVPVIILLLAILIFSQENAAFRRQNLKKLRTYSPSKRIVIPHPNSIDPNAYLQGKSYRRQEVIHALSDDSKKNDDDDIESLGKTIDSTGAVIKQVIPKATQDKTNEEDPKINTKDIIAKIKEIQDRLFKRTGNADLEKKLKQMSDLVPLPYQSTTNNKTDSNGSEHTSKTEPLGDGSKKPERRKIIPEEVVDKILEKFQQLRQEAKHMALLETKHGAEKEGNSASNIDQTKVSTFKQSSPYASIGPPKENTELKNKTSQNPSITTVGIDSQADLQSQSPPETTVPDSKNNNNIEIPINNAANLNGQNAQNNPNPMPVMFIKNGQMLVPVFGGVPGAGSLPMSVTGNGMAQLNANPGVAMPNMPHNVFPVATQQQLAAFLGTIPNLFANRNMGFNSMQRTNPIQSGPMFQGQNQLQAYFGQPSSNQYIPLHSEIEDAASRCSIPGSDCPTPTQGYSEFMQPNPTGNIATVDNAPSTTDLIRNILNAPGFPQLAARLMSEPRRYRQQNREPETGDSRGFNNVPPRNEMAFQNENMQDMNPGSVQFKMQPGMFNQAPRDDPGSLFSQPTNPSGPLVANPFQDVNLERNDKMEQMEGENQLFNSRNVAMNDISDPPSENNNFQQQSPDQLLDFARMKSNSKYHDDRPDQYENDSPQTMLPTRMSIEHGGTERSLLSGVDPGSLLDKIHGAQLKGGLLGPGDPGMFNPTKSFKTQNTRNGDFEGSPDDLLEMLRNQNDKVFSKQFTANDDRRLTQMRSRKYPDGLDPSFADDIQDSQFGQSMDVQRKEVAENGQGQFESRHRLPGRNSDISVLPDNFVQYKHGRMSMDSANVINSFFRDPQFYRNTIAHPPGVQNSTRYTNKGIQKPIVRASIEKTLPEDNVELQVNGKAITNRHNLRSRIINGKIVEPKGKTFFSKTPVQIELSHDVNKKKIINIVTKSKYNITEGRKRMKIPRMNLVSD